MNVSTNPNVGWLTLTLTDQSEPQHKQETFKLKLGSQSVAIPTCMFWRRAARRASPYKICTAVQICQCVILLAAFIGKGMSNFVCFARETGVGDIRPAMDGTWQRAKEREREE